MSHPIPGRVSVVIPAYNSARTIAASIESCLAQSYPDVEVVVVNDGSPDPALGKVLRDFGERIRLVEQPNGGVASARNASVRAARGEFIAWMDDDDLMEPDRLHLQVALARAHPDIVLSSTEFSAFSSAGEIEAAHSATYYSAVRRMEGMERIYPEVREAPGVGAFRAGSVYERLFRGNFVHPPTVLVRREVFDRVGYFDTGLRYSSDWDQIIRIARLGPFAFIPRPLLRYRRGDGQLSHAASGGRMPLETVRVLDKVRAADPDLYHRNRGVFDERFARAYIEAAEVIAPAEGARATGLLLRSLRHRIVPGPWLHAFAKAVLPRALVAALRRDATGSKQRMLHGDGVPRP